MYFSNIISNLPSGLRVGIDILVLISSEESARASRNSGCLQKAQTHLYHPHALPELHYKAYRAGTRASKKIKIEPNRASRCCSILLNDVVVVFLSDDMGLGCNLMVWMDIIIVLIDFFGVNGFFIVAGFCLTLRYILATCSLTAYK